MIRLARYLKHFKKEVIVGPFFKLLEAIFELIVPLVMASIIDRGIKYEDKAYIFQRGGIILLLGIMGLIFALICQYNAAKASQGFGTMVRNDVFQHINSLSHGELDKLGTNYLITVITNDVNQMQLAVAMLIRLVVRVPFLIIGAAVMAMLLDLKLSFIFLLVIPMVSAVLYIVMIKSVPYYRRRQKALDKVSLITREGLSGARVIRAFSKQEREELRFEEANQDTAQIGIRVGRISAFLNPAVFAITNLAILAILWFGGFRVNIGSLTQGEVIAFINYMTQISLALVVFANLVNIFTKAGASATRINQLFDIKPALMEGSYQGDEKTGKALELDYNQKEGKPAPLFELKCVSFAYPGSEEYSLENINLSIESGQTIGIIGGTGSGKTTLINLLPRFYDVTKGEILMDGKPLKEYSFEALRKQFGIVLQKAVLFHGTILENMRWANPEATVEEIQRGIEIAQAKEFVEKLPSGYETMLQQGGKNLSGGQRQRLTIARALVGNPRVLILDDSSSALDYATDARLRRALKEACQEMTILMVSQRANTIKHADKILVLEDGRIVGIGKHEELFQTCEVYREICLSQYSSEEVNR